MASFVHGFDNGYTTDFVESENSEPDIDNEDEPDIENGVDDAALVPHKKKRRLAGDRSGR